MDLEAQPPRESEILFGWLCMVTFQRMHFGLVDI